MTRIIQFYFITLFIACATNHEPVPNYDYGELRRPAEFNQEQKQDQKTEDSTPAPTQTVDHCSGICTSFNELDTKCDLANDACEAKTNYLKSSCEKDCTKIAAREAVDCKGSAVCIDRVAAGESDCKLSCASGASDNAKCKEAIAICSKKAMVEKTLGSCKC